MIIKTNRCLDVQWNFTCAQIGEKGESLGDKMLKKKYGVFPKFHRSFSENVGISLFFFFFFFIFGEKIQNRGVIGYTI